MRQSKNEALARLCGLRISSSEDGQGVKKWMRPAPKTKKSGWAYDYIDLPNYFTDDSAFFELLAVVLTKLPTEGRIELTSYVACDASGVMIFTEEDKGAGLTGGYDLKTALAECAFAAFCGEGEE